MPLLHLPARFIDDPLADASVEVALLCGRQELSRCNETDFGMAPANQRLDALDPPGLHIHLRVIVKLELIAAEGSAEARYQRGALESAGVQLGNVEAEHVPSALLGLEDRSRGVLDQCIGVGAVLR